MLMPLSELHRLTNPLDCSFSWQRRSSCAAVALPCGHDTGKQQPKQQRTMGTDVLLIPSSNGAKATLSLKVNYGPLIPRALIAARAESVPWREAESSSKRFSKSGRGEALRWSRRKRRPRRRARRDQDCASSCRPGAVRPRSRDGIACGADGPNCGDPTPRRDPSLASTRKPSKSSSTA